MTVLLAIQNKGIVLKYFPKAVFRDGTNTCTFKIQKASFAKLQKDVKAEGYNPYALFHW